MSSQRIACPRPDCKRVINLGSPATPPAGTVPVPEGMCRVICSHCAESFVVCLSNSGAVSIVQSRIDHFVRFVIVKLVVFPI